MDRDRWFTHADFEALGYRHRVICGQKGYHGVATVSRIPLREIGRHDWQDNGEARHVGVELLGEGQGLILENVYIPAGGDIPDREANPKFGQKLDFLERMTRWADALDRPTLIVGDFNVAPLECDVYDHKALLKVVSHTPIECEALGPISVHPKYQGRGIGRALVEAGAAHWREAGAKGVVLLGDPALYGRFGFVRDTPLHIDGPLARYFQVLPFTNEIAAASVTFAPAFGLASVRSG